MFSFIKKISSKLKSKFYYDYNTSKNVWFRSGGNTSVFCLVYDLSELQIILKEINDYPFEIIGVGSNFLIRDRGFNGVILKLGKKFNNIQLYDSLNEVEVGAGLLDVNLAKYAELNDIKNFEFFSGIPGTIGGAIKMNAGCYGSETKDIVKNVSIIDKKGSLINLNKDQINFKYRESNLPKQSTIIAATFYCEYGEKKDIQNKMKKIKEKREKSQPIRLKTSGSTFKNPLNHFAAQLIEQSGCKGLSVGDAFVSEKHANFLINKNQASASDIEKLGSIIIDRVHAKFNIKLEWEIKIIG